MPKLDPPPWQTFLDPRIGRNPRSRVNHSTNEPLRSLGEARTIKCVNTAMGKGNWDESWPTSPAYTAPLCRPNPSAGLCSQTHLSLSLYLNNFPEQVRSRVRLFADDTQGWGGGYSNFFFVRRLGPSIYRSPPKISGISKIIWNFSKPKKYTNSVPWPL